MAVKVIALVTINDDAPLALAQYLDVTTPLLEKAGAKIIQRFTLNEAVVGKRPAQSVVIVEYPSKEAVSDVFDSTEYQAIKSVRDRAFSNYQVSIVAD